MRTLSKEKIDQINQKIGSSQVHYTDIRAELADHIASKIEAVITNEDEFEGLLQKSMAEVNPKKFQRQLLICSHLGMAKHLFCEMLRPMILLKSALLCSTWVSLVFFLNDLTPDTAAKHIKTLMVAGFIGTALLSFSRDLLKNSSLVTAVNTFLLIFFIGQFALTMDLLIFLGLSDESALYTITFLLSLIYVSGISQVTREYKKLKTA